jgi:hypothetical protein
VAHELDAVSFRTGGFGLAMENVSAATDTARFDDVLVTAA